MKFRWLKWLRLLALSAVVTTVPIAAADYVLSQHALSVGQAEADSMAARYLARAETTVAEALRVLADLRTSGRITCGLADRTAFGMTAFNSEFIVQIGLTDEAGTLICGEPMGALAAPARLPVAEKGDPSVMLSVLSDGKDKRQAVVTLRVDDRLRLVARLASRSLDIEAGASYFEDASVTSIYLDDGSEWSKFSGKWTESDQSAALVSTISSERYPIKVRVAVDEMAAQKSIAGLRAITIILSTLAGLGVFIIVTWSMWRQSDGDSFSRAVDNHEFIPYYQPVFDLMTGEIRGCEVLVRWLRPDGTMVAPGQFLPYAEATGAIRDITRQLMTQTVADVSDIYDKNPGLKLAINLTAMHFNDLEIMDDIKRIYGNSKIRYEQLCFEVTEQHPLKDLALSRAIIGRIQALGASVALDDVGTGHGGLAYLQKLGVDIIKIDKMFIDHIGTDHSSQTIVDTLVELGHQLGLGIVAEGVERPDQVEHLKSIGVVQAQGYIYSPPIPVKAFREFALKSLERSKSGLGARSDKPVEVSDSFASLTVSVDDEGEDEASAA